MKIAGGVRLKPDTTFGEERPSAARPLAGEPAATPAEDTTGRSIADVSYPRRAATSAAAASSAAVARSGSTIRASTKSTTPSWLRSWNTTPGLKNSASEDGDAGGGDC